jgi:cytidylate kinase
LGSGGTAISKIVANALEFTYWDKKIMQEVALETGTSAERVERYDETPPTGLSSALLKLLDSHNITDTVYVRSLYHVLKGIQRRGRAVIVGRGAVCVLPEVVKVRVIAPFEVRARRIAALRNLDRKEAEKLVLESDHSRRQFLERSFACDPDEPLLYDLIINTECLSLEHAAELIVQRVRQTWKDE